jgi:hypothetical protein
MTAFNKFDCFVEDLAHKQHDLGSDTLGIELVASANAPVASDTTITPISYANLPDSRQLANVVSGQVGGVYTLSADALILTATGTVATFKYVVLVNLSAAAGHQLIGWFEIPAEVTLLAGKKITIDLESIILSLT